MDFSNNDCKQCPNGEYSLDQTDIYCHKCPDNAYCDFNGSFINVLPGYWRSDYFSTVITECLIPEACSGNSCRNGHEGPLCDSCLDGYYKSLQVGCEKCENALSSYFVMAVVIVIFL